MFNSPQTTTNDSNMQSKESLIKSMVSMEPPSSTPLTDVKTFALTTDGETVLVSIQQPNLPKYRIVPPAADKPYYSIVDRATGKFYWELKARVASSKGELTPAWDASNRQATSSPMTYEENLRGYVTTYKGKVYLWKITNGGGLYCVQGLNNTGKRVAEYDAASNKLNIDISRRESASDAYADSTSFETFIILTGHAINVEIQRVEKSSWLRSLIPSWTSSLLCWGCFCA